jgi:HEAT repeat protein
MSHPDPRVRSKAALLVGRSNKNHKWVKDRLAEADPRVRANAIESLWGSDSDGSRAVFWTALGDDDDRVVGNAILALYRMGDPASIQLLLQLIAHPEIPFRVTGVWAMGETGDPRFMPMLARMIAEQVRELRANAFRAMAKIKKAIAARTAGESFNVMLGPLRRARDNWVEFIAAIRSASGAQPPELNFTNFALWEDSKLVREYTIRQRGKQEPVAVAIGMPRIVDRFSPEQEIQQNSAEQGLRYKRQQDVWTVLKYIAIDPEHEVSAAMAAAMSPADEDLTSARMRFTKNPDAIAAAIAKPGTRLVCAGNLSQTARCLIAWVRQMNAARNVILICQSPADILGPDVHEQIEAAEAASVAVHIISPWPSDAMQELCSHTQGTLLVPANQEGIPDALEAMCASLLNSYEVRFKPENEGASKLRIQVYTATAMGEASQKLP